MHKDKSQESRIINRSLSSTSNNKKGKMVELRRDKVQQSLVRGYSQWDVAEGLQIDQSNCKQRCSASQTKCPSESSKHIQQKLPEEYQR